MKWIEIITLRSLVKANRQLVDELLHQVFKQKGIGARCLNQGLSPSHC